MPSPYGVIATWQVVNAMLAGAVVVWLIVIFRERRRSGDYLSGGLLAIASMLFAIGAGVASLYNFHNSYGFRPSMPFVTLGGVAMLWSARATIRRAGHKETRREDP